MNRREFLYLLGGTAVGAGGLAGGLWLKNRPSAGPGALSLDVNDIHSKLNAARVRAIERPETLEEVLGIVRRAVREKETLCVSGSRHAMGGQQFADGATLLDTRGLKSVMDLDTKAGLIQVEAGIEWPELVEELASRQKGTPDYWTIRSKQTGADKLTLGGAISANAHGRALSHPPIVADMAELLIVNADGETVIASRDDNGELFSLATGGYGLFGLVHSVVYRLERRQKIQRIVEILDADQVMSTFEERIADGYTSGDWQYAIDESTDDYLHKGVFSCYKPVPIDTEIEDDQVGVSDRAWKELVYLAHTDKARGFQLYSDFYMESSGQVYWSDTSQIGGYDVDYHVDTDRRMKAIDPATEMITEIYVPRDRLVDFLDATAVEFRKVKANVIYGTVRLIEKDDVSFLAWAKQPYACIIFNLHVVHTEEKIAEAADAFRLLIDLAIERGGSYYLTYHRWARKDQILACYPQFPEFLQKKASYDPERLFQSDWYRHYVEMFDA
ncbi:MAG: FAD-binding oxidoreductase [Armatimonadetes bacterium]|nr:FAD-binding oxidoreductase [Armatimonadota bacterium]